MSDSRPSVLIQDALIFDGLSSHLVSGDIEVVDGVITEVGTKLERRNGLIIPARGRFVMPGMIDAHFHAYGSSLSGIEMDAQKPSYVALAAAGRLSRALRRGFTTVRDVAGGDAGLAKAIVQGLISSPHYLYTGAALSQTGGHGDQRPLDLDLAPQHSHVSEIVDGVEAVRQAVRERFRGGAHAIKMMMSGGVSSPTDPLLAAQYSSAEIAAAVAEASRRGSYVAAHSYGPASIQHAVTNGVRSIEHGNLLDSASAELMSAAGAFLVPTLVAYDSMHRRGRQHGLSESALEKNDHVLAAGRESLGIARRAGVPIGFGTDLLGELEDDQLIGLRIQAEVDSTWGLLDSVTRVNAQLIGDPKRGRVAAGAHADLLILNENPLENPAVLDSISARTVIQGGRVVRWATPPIELSGS